MSQHHWFDRFMHRLVTPIDGFLFLLILLLFTLSLVVLYSASNMSMDKIYSKLLFMGVSLLIMWLVANVKPQQLMQLALPTYLLTILLLVGVAVAGDIVNGSRRWLNIGFTRIQPSEFAKITVPMMLAWYFQRNEGFIRWKQFIIALVFTAIPTALVLKQPDLGTSLLIISSGLFVIFFAGLPWKVIALAVLSFAGSLPILWNMLHDYQRRRVLTLLDPTADPLGAGYHIIQSMIAIGSGGSFGKGWLSGTQTHLEFLPERTTDFIFAVYAEEFGLMGNILLLVLYLLVIGRGMVIAAKATTLFGRLFASALVMALFTYAFVNMGMVSGILPVVGVPLPLVSYGGTSMVSLAFAFGAMMSIHKNRPLIKR